MINCIVVDDEPHAIEVLAHYIRQTPSLNLSGTAGNPAEAMSLLQEKQADLIFLDIHMPQVSGLDFIRMINERYKVILCTAYPNYAVEGFELDVLDYLVKPVPMPRFLKAVQKAIDCIGHIVQPEENDFIVVKTGVKGSMRKINLDDIQFIEASKNYVTIHHGNEKSMALISMKELEERLPAAKFMRVHKSFIVSIGSIKGIDGNSILLKNTPSTILLGDAYRNVFLDMMKNKLVGR